MSTILIAEDHPANRLVLTAVLERAGHTVFIASDGVEALARIRASNPDLVITDLLMPRMDGFELVRQLRQDPALAGMRVVFYTATYDTPEARTLATACGVEFVLMKPATAEGILETVAAALAGPAPSASPISIEELDHGRVCLLLEKLACKVQELEVTRAQLAHRGKAIPARSPAQPILLVEDNPMDVDLTRQGFEEHNIANPLVVCRDGEEAIRYIDTHSSPADPRLPLLVLLDLRLPKVDGLDVLRHARQQPAWRDLNIIVLSTSHENIDIAAARQVGATHYIVKPVDFTAFSDVVKEIKVRWILVPENRAS